MTGTKALMERLWNLEGAVRERRNIHANVIGTKSPTFNFAFGNGWGLPWGYSMLLFGPEKGGKSLITNAMIAQLHADYPDAVAVKFNTELREEAQLNSAQMERLGIDPDRLIAYDVNSPKEVFNRFAHDISACCDDGLQIHLAIIDSIQGILGRRSEDNDDIDTQQVGDFALTVQEGLKQIIKRQRKHQIALVITSQIRAEMDRIEQMRGHHWRAGVPKAVFHHCEYFMWVEANKNKDAGKDMLGNEFKNENLRDLADKKFEQTGHKIRVCLRDNSFGPKGRTGEFTYDYDNGIINTHEEVFLLGRNRGVIERPNQTSYEFGGRKWTGQAAMIQAIRDDSDLSQAILAELRRRDVAKLFAEETNDTVGSLTEQASTK